MELQLRSLVDLDFAQAWRHLLFWIRRFPDASDRLPFESVDRIYGGPPALSAEHQLRPLVTVMATKGSGTARPFVSLSPTDLLLYQALVNVLAIAIEEAPR
jgi:hypothetical protein